MEEGEQGDVEGAKIENGREDVEDDVGSPGDMKFRAMMTFEPFLPALREIVPQVEFRLDEPVVNGEWDRLPQVGR